jgi:uncharacterized membrane protein YgcG
MTPPTNIDTAPQPSGQQAQPQRHGDELIMFLEQEQLVSDRSIAVPPAQLSGRARAALWLLRIFALIVSFMVIYTFVSQLH